MFVSPRFAPARFAAEETVVLSFALCSSAAAALYDTENVYSFSSAQSASTLAASTAAKHHL